MQKKIPVQDLLLDPKNPRHEPLEDQKDIVERFLQKEQVLALAKDIVANGLSPIEAIGVFKQNGQYVVFEGNRRICALQLLNDPELAGAKKAQFEKIINGAATPKEVNCYVFSSREEAKIWQERRHGGQLEGKGLKSWDAAQKNRFFEQGDYPLAGGILEYAVSQGVLTSEQAQEGLITTVHRFFANPQFRTALGITTGRKERNPKIQVSLTDFKKGVKKLCDDLVNKNITSRTTSAEREKYIEEVLYPLVGKDYVTPHKLDVMTGQLQEASSLTHTRIRPRHDPDARKHIIRGRVQYPEISDAHLNRLFIELKKLNCRDYPFSAGFLIRAFLENLSRFYYQLEKNEAWTDGPLHKLFQEVAGILETQGINSKPLAMMVNNKDHILSPHSMGSYVHGMIVPDPTQFCREWDNLEASVQYMLGKVAPTLRTDLFTKYIG